MSDDSPISVPLWTWSLDVGQAEVNRAAAFLSKDECARAYRYVFPRDRDRFIVARGTMREILARRVGTSPKQVEFAYAEHGKPSIAIPVSAPRFNLSHSLGCAALAISERLEIGIDIEAIQPLKEDIAGQYFSKRERDELSQLPPENRLAGFYRCWTRKEAVIKALGEGLLRSLDSFEVLVSRDGHARLERLVGEPDAVRNWKIIDLDLGPGFVGALACRTGGRPVAVVHQGAPRPPRLASPEANGA
jgi:4'-phosphopantetheinyl transferase